MGCVIQNSASQLSNIQNPQSISKLQKAFPVQLQGWLMHNTLKTATVNKHIWKTHGAHVTSLIYVTKPPKAMTYQYCSVSLSSDYTDQKVKWFPNFTTIPFVHTNKLSRNHAPTNKVKQTIYRRKIIQSSCSLHHWSVLNIAVPLQGYFQTCDK